MITNEIDKELLCLFQIYNFDSFEVYGTQKLDSCTNLENAICLYKIQDWCARSIGSKISEILIHNSLHFLIFFQLSISFSFQI